MRIEKGAVVVGVKLQGASSAGRGRGGVWLVVEGLVARLALLVDVCQAWLRREEEEDAPQASEDLGGRGHK